MKLPKSQKKTYIWGNIHAFSCVFYFYSTYKKNVSTRRVMDLLVF